MRSSLHERSFDVVIIDATSGPGTEGQRLHDECARRGLRAQLDRMPTPRSGNLPPLTGARAGQAKCCLLLLSARAGTVFMTFPAPRGPGESLELGIARAQIGCVGEDVKGLVDQVAGRLANPDRS